MQLGGHGEDDMEVRDGQQIALLGLDPARFVQPLALGAMPIATGVVGELLMAARPRTARRWPPSARRAALGDGLRRRAAPWDRPPRSSACARTMSASSTAAGAGRLGAHGERYAWWRGAGWRRSGQAIERALGGLQVGGGDVGVALGGAQAAVAEQQSGSRGCSSRFPAGGWRRRAAANRGRRAW